MLRQTIGIKTYGLLGHQRLADQTAVTDPVVVELASVVDLMSSSVHIPVPQLTGS